jgi:hypothetical protein
VLLGIGWPSRSNAKLNLTSLFVPPPMLIDHTTILASCLRKEMANLVLGNSSSVSLRLQLVCHRGLQRVKTIITSSWRFFAFAPLSQEPIRLSWVGHPKIQSNV